MNNKYNLSILYYKNKIPLCNKRMLNEYIKNNNKQSYFNLNNIVFIFILVFIITTIIILYQNKKLTIN